MRSRRWYNFLILFAIISFVQACAPHPESIEPLHTEVNTLNVDFTVTATEFRLTATPQPSRTSTESDVEPTDIDSETTWLISEEKSASIAALLGLSGENHSSDPEDDQTQAIIPTATIPASVITPEPTDAPRTPEPTQFAGCPNGCTVHPPGCDIKGNISFTTGEKIYHVPGGEFYDECVINPDYGERWFCTEQEAIDSGWRKSMY